MSKVFDWFLRMLKDSDGEPSAKRHIAWVGFFVAIGITFFTGKGVEYVIAFLSLTGVEGIASVMEKK